jgi:hypothetical protein
VRVAKSPTNSVGGITAGGGIILTTIGLSSLLQDVRDIESNIRKILAFKIKLFFIIFLN